MSMTTKPAWIVVRGGGDLASGVALRLHRCGLRLLITELPQPLVVRRKVAFAEAVFTGEIEVEGAAARHVPDIEAARRAFGEFVPVLVDPELQSLQELNRLGHPAVVVDARMTKNPPLEMPPLAALVIGLGPGFVPGKNCHVAIETNRGHNMGRVLWDASPEPDTGVPESVIGRGAERVLRSPADGLLAVRVEIGDHVEAGEVVADVDGQPVRAAFDGVVRGLVHAGSSVTRGLKIGDIDPRDDRKDCFTVSDKSLAVGGAVLEAILSREDLRSRLWDSPAQ